MRRFAILGSFLFLVLFVLSACAGDPLRAARDKGFIRREIQAGPFSLLTLVRKMDRSEPMTIYIEGDGFAWADRSTPSTDPTPHRAVALELALLDEAANVAYLARPCQYVWSDACKKEYWTSGRFAPEIIDSLNAAVSILAAQTRGVHLVGYSGGGGMAVLLAARRDDVLSLRTVAGNLDLKLFEKHHGVTPMTGSYDPVSVAFDVRALPQAHWVGGRDEIVPRAIAESFLEKAGGATCATILSVEEADHEDGWGEAWEKALNNNPFAPCAKARNGAFFDAR